MLVVCLAAPLSVNLCLLVTGHVCIEGVGQEELWRETKTPPEASVEIETPS